MFSRVWALYTPGMLLGMQLTIISAHTYPRLHAKAVPGLADVLATSAPCWRYHLITAVLDAKTLPDIFSGNKGPEKQQGTWWHR